MFLRFTFLTSFVSCFAALQAQNHMPPSRLDSIPQLKERVESFYSETKGRIPKNEYTPKQRTYLKNHYKSRMNESLRMMRKKELIADGSLYQLTDSLFRVILERNPQLKGNYQLYLYHDYSFNAFTLGDDIIYLNLGLLHRMDTYEELSFVICHEIAHNELDHFEIKTADYARTFINDSLEKKLVAAYSRAYGKVTAINKLYLPCVLSSRELSRKLEMQADSMACELINNCNLSIPRAKFALYTLQHVHEERSDHNFDLVKTLELPATMDFQRQLSFQKSSSLGTFESKEDEWKEVLQTHPYPEARLEAINRRYTEEPENLLPEEEEKFNAFRYGIDHDIIQSAFEHRNLGRALFYWLNTFENKEPTRADREQLALIFAVLSYEKNRHREGFLIDLSTPNTSENYDRVLYFLRRLNPQECLDITTHYFESLNREKPSTSMKYVQAFISALQKDFKTFKPLYQELKSDEQFEYYPLLEEIYKFNRSAINKVK